MSLLCRRPRRGRRRGLWAIVEPLRWAGLGILPRAPGRRLDLAVFGPSLWRDRRWVGATCERPLPSIGTDYVGLCKNFAGVQMIASLVGVLRSW